MKKRIHKLNLLTLAAALLLSACSIFSIDISQPPAAPTGAAALPAPATPTTVTSLPQATHQAPAQLASPVLIPSAQADVEMLGDLARYQIDLALDMQAHNFTGSQSVVYTNTETVPLDRLYFRLLPNGGASLAGGSLAVENVMLDGQPVQTQLSQSDTVLEVPLPVELQPGESLQLQMDFNGAVPLDFGGGDPPLGYGIYNMSQGVFALSSWYPQLAVYDDDGWNLDMPSPIGDSVYSDTAFYTVSVQVPEAVQVAATGSLVDEQSASGQKTLRFDSGPARDFFLIASPDFQTIDLQVGDTLVKLHFLPGHEISAEQALSVAADSLEVYNEKFGLYPFSELDVVDAPMNYALGVEFPGIVLVASSLFDAPQKPEFAVATAHEVAHQWWYNVVGNDVFDDPWLDEALTSYSSSFYYEFGPYKSVPEPLIESWQQRYDQLLKDGEDEVVTRNLDYFEALNQPRIYGGVVYRKGALFFEALRQQIGDQAFFAALQQYYQDYKYGVASTEDLLELFEQASGTQLDDFYQQWLYSKGS